MYSIILAMASNPQGGQSQGSGLMGLLPFVLIFFVMWFFMIRPQSKKQKEMQKMLESIQVNDWVLTNGGIIGRVTAIKSDKNIVVIEIDDTNHVRVEFQKSSIVTILNKDNNQAAVS